MSIEQWQAALQDGGFVFVHAPDMEATLAENGLTGWDAFARSWDDLGLDTYMADGGRYRKRRHAAFAASAAGVVRKPAQPHPCGKMCTSWRGRLSLSATRSASFS